MSGVHSISQWDLYVVTNDRLHPYRSHLDVAQAAIQGGADVIQLRDKHASGARLYQLGLELRQLTQKAGVTFIVNDRMDIALSVDADGLHLGQDDLPVEIARRCLGHGKILGVSVGSVAQAQQAQKDGADYLGVGPIFEARLTKPDAGLPCGLDLLTEIHRASCLPLVAIGGIDLENIDSVCRAGADCAAVVSAVVCASDMTEAVSRLKDRLQSIKDPSLMLNLEYIFGDPHEQGTDHSRF